MNSLIEDEFPLRATQSLRYDLMNILTDSDLAYRLPGNTLSLGELCREMGAIEELYIRSFKTFKYDWKYQNDDPELATSVERLKAWYQALDEEFEQVVRGFSEEDLHTKRVDRGEGRNPTLSGQFFTYHQAIMMFYAKASIYVRALEKTVNDQWDAWIG